MHVSCMAQDIVWLAIDAVIQEVIEQGQLRSAKCFKPTAITLARSLNNVNPLMKGVLQYYYNVHGMRCIAYHA